MTALWIVWFVVACLLFVGGTISLLRATEDAYASLERERQSDYRKRAPIYRRNMRIYLIWLFLMPINAAAWPLAIPVILVLGARHLWKETKPDSKEIEEQLKNLEKEAGVQ